MSEADDARWVRRCLGGDRNAFEALIDRHQKKVFNVVLRLVHNVEDARDVTQTAFLKAFKNLEKFDARYRFYTWIYRIAVNESVNFLKRTERFEPGTIDHWESRARNPEDVLAGHQLSAAVQESLTMLPTDQRTVIVLRHFGGCTYRDIGETLGIPEKTVKSRLFTARQRLRGLLSSRSVHRP